MEYSMIVGKVERYVQSLIKPWPCNTNRASEIGHECERYLVFLRTKGGEKKLHSLDSQFIFMEGAIQERAVLRLLDDAGIEVIEQQRPFEWKDHQLTGHIDGKIIVDGGLLPLEVKSMAPWIFDKTNTLDDFFNSKYYWIRKYPAQLTMYMLMDAKDRALFLLKNKSTGKLKEVLIELDYDYGESLVQKAERVNQYIADKIIPEPIQWGDVCSKCDFNHICVQEVLRTELEFVVDPDLEEKIIGYHELKPWYTKWKEIDEELKESLRGVERLVVGEWLITGKPFGKGGWKISYNKI